MEFKQGDRVQWTPHSQGSFTTKVGTVVGHVPPKMSIVDVWNDAYPDKPFVRGRCGNFTSLHDRHLVLTDQSILYSPSTGTLRLLTEEPSSEI